MKNNHISLEIIIFHGRKAPEQGILVGYGAIIEAFELKVPLPEELSLISHKKRQYVERKWHVFTSRHLPGDTLYKQLVFALKYEGVNLLVLKKLFEKLTHQETLDLLQDEPTGQYSRRLWFLYEWLFQTKLPIKDLDKGNYVNVINEKFQYAISVGARSARHRVVNNLPGSVNFCPLIKKTEKLENYILANVAEQKSNYLKEIKKDILQRASTFLLLKDSKASFTIEGESPKSKRATRWGQAIGQAGVKDIIKEELIRLQQLVIENSRFVDMGFRQKGGFVGEHDRVTGEPLPEHISARCEDVEVLIDGLMETNKILLNNEIDAVLAATSIAFGFVFIHPFEDGNGRIHRYLIHHLLAKKNFAQQGMIFPVSASILDQINDYRKVLQSYSHPLLDFIEWKETKDHNIEVLNQTIDYYRYFDVTKQAEFLYDCVNDTIEHIIPSEVSYLTRFDKFKSYVDDEFEMPDKLVSLLVRFLEQNDGKLSNRAREKEFESLNKEEVTDIEEHFRVIMLEQ